jgi:XTP/dITP diphosphohydrolase
MKLVFATNNPNKLKEVQEMLSDHIQLLSLKDIGCFEDIPETATTLEGNAKIKADHVTKNYGYDCFADDTGLEVDSLNGEPGVYSARYGGKERSAEKNMRKLLTNLEGQRDRSAQFRTIVTLNLQGKSYDFEGICRGTILQEQKGDRGFGYDPIFQPEGYQETFAEMNSEEKNKISHRGLAIQKLVEFLNAID